MIECVEYAITETIPKGGHYADVKIKLAPLTPYWYIYRKVYGRNDLMVDYWTETGWRYHTPSKYGTPELAYQAFLENIQKGIDSRGL